MGLRVRVGVKVEFMIIILGRANRIDIWIVIMIGIGIKVEVRSGIVMRVGAEIGFGRLLIAIHIGMP